MGSHLERRCDRTGLRRAVLSVIGLSRQSPDDDSGLVGLRTKRRTFGCTTNTFSPSALESLDSPAMLSQTARVRNRAASRGVPHDLSISPVDASRVCCPNVAP